MRAHHEVRNGKWISRYLGSDRRLGPESPLETWTRCFVAMIVEVKLARVPRIDIMLVW